jgi:uncharacterized protein
MTWLLDGNVLVALVLDGHIHHQHVLDWFESRGQRRFATCVITQGTLLRIHMSFAPDRGAAAAWATLKAVENHPRHEYWGDAFAYSAVPHRHLQGAKQVTDAWLAELARGRRSKLATLDRSLAALHADVAEAVPV